jgi:hypothetical protein
VAVLVLAGAIAALVVFNSRKVAMCAALGALAIMFTTIVRISELFMSFAQMSSGLERGNAFVEGLSSLLSASIGFGFGWLPLLAGALIVFVAGLSDIRGSFLPNKKLDSADDHVFNSEEVVTRYLQRYGTPIARERSKTQGPAFGKRKAS